MQVFVLVLNREEFLEPLLEEMLKQNIGGATILESTGMMRVLDGDHNIDDLPVLGVLRHLCNPERKRSKTIFTLLKSEQIPQMIEIINKVTGGLDKPDTGICFALPTTLWKGSTRTNEYPVCACHCNGGWHGHDAPD